MTLWRRVLIVLLLALPVSARAGEAVVTADATGSHPLAITNVNIVDVTDGSIWRNATIYIRGNKIVWVARHALLEHGKNLRVVNGVDRYVIPGLWNMHIRLVQDVPLEYTERVLLPLLIANGVTGVRDMGGNLARLQSLRKRIDSGALLGPHISYSGPALDGPQTSSPDFLAINTPDEARAAVLDLKQQGADFLKVQSRLPRLAYFAAAEEAKRQGLIFAGRVPDTVTAVEASEAGQRSMEHLANVLRACSSEEQPIMASAAEFARRVNVTSLETSAFTQFQRERILRSFSQSKADALFYRFVSNRNWQTPTLVSQRFEEYADVAEWEKDPRMRFVPSPMRAQWKQQRDSLLRDSMPGSLLSAKSYFRKVRQLVGVMRRQYVHLLAGTDTAPYVFPGSALLDELHLLVDNGITPLDALRAATIEPALVMRRQNEYGAVAQGRIADMVFLDGNPLEDIGNVQKISAVVANGRYYDRHDLDAIIERAAAAAAAIK